MTLAHIRVTLRRKKSNFSTDLCLFEFDFLRILPWDLSPFFTTMWGIFLDFLSKRLIMMQIQAEVSLEKRLSIGSAIEEDLQVRFKTPTMWAVVMVYRYVHNIHINPPKN